MKVSAHNKRQKYIC